MAASLRMLPRTLRIGNLVKALPNEAVQAITTRMTQSYGYKRNLFLGTAGLRQFRSDRYASKISIEGSDIRTGRSYCTIVNSPYPDLDIPTNIPLHEYMLNEFVKYGSATALLDGVTGEELSYSRLQTMVVKATSALIGMGFGHGSVATLYSANCVEYIVMFLAVGAAGGIISAVNPVYTKDELMKAVKQVKSELLLVSEELLPTAEKIIQLCPTIKNTVVFGKIAKYRPFSSLLENDMSLFPKNLNVNAREDVYAIPFSSGTTGLPKGVMLTHYNLLSNVLQARAPMVMNYQPGRDVLLATLPFFHIYGQVIVALAGLAAGVKMVVMAKFEPHKYMDAVQKYSVTHLHVVPPLMLFLAKHPMVTKYDVSSVLSVITGAAPCGLETLREVSSRFSKNTTIRNGYGLTEASPMTHCSPLNGSDGYAVGPAVPNTQYKIVDLESRKSLGPGVSGELLVRGPQVMKGYYDNPSATAETLVDGWLHTGDVGYYNEDGVLNIVDRFKELIKVKGLQVAPAELEALLLTHEAVADAAVIGRKDERAGEAPVAFVVLKPSHKPSEATAKQLQQFVADHVAPYKRLTGGIKFRNEIPKAASGKILRRILKTEL